jgi:hypothetical protein
MPKIDFEFVSTHRNRSLWRNPCAFEVPWSGNGQKIGLNAADPVSDQAPLVEWTGRNIAIAITVVRRTAKSVIVSAPINAFSKTPNYYAGAQLGVVRIDSYGYLSSSATLDYAQLFLDDSETAPGTTSTITTTVVPNTVFVPAGSDLPNAYNGYYLYNDTLHAGVKIRAYDSEFHTILADVPPSWTATNDYCVRRRLPSVESASLGPGNTVDVLNLGGTVNSVVPGDFVRVVTSREVVKIVKYDETTRLATVSPRLPVAYAAGTVVELLTTTSDNYRTMSYSGTTVGQHEQAAYDVNLVSGTVPNTRLKRGGGYPSDHPFLYVELYDTNLPSQNNLFSNNHSNKSYFKVTTPTGQLMNRREKFTKVTGDLNHKTIRFRPTSNFRVCWRLPSGDELEFEKDDTFSPLAPDDGLQTSLVFSLDRCRY